MVHDPARGGEDGAGHGAGSVRAGVRAASATRRRRPRHTATAGLVEVEARRLHERRAAPGVAAYWAELSAENGHFRKVAAALDEEQRSTFLAELEERFAPYREGDGLSLPRTLVLAAGRRAAG